MSHTSLRKSETVTILEGITTTMSRTNKHAQGRRSRGQNEFPVHDRPPSHERRIERRALVGHTPTRLPALCRVCRGRWSIVALFGTMGPEYKNERSRGKSDLSVAITSNRCQGKSTHLTQGLTVPPAIPFPSSLLTFCAAVFWSVYLRTHNITQPSDCQGQMAAPAEKVCAQVLWRAA